MEVRKAIFLTEAWFYIEHLLRKNSGRVCSLFSEQRIEEKEDEFMKGAEEGTLVVVEVLLLPQIFFGGE